MHTFPITMHGTIRAIEVENAYVDVSTLAAILRRIPGVSDVQTRKLFRGPREIRASFSYHGVPFAVSEPFGDSSRYWIGPAEEAQPPDMTEINDALRAHHLPLWRTMIGNIFSLRLHSPR